MAQMHIFSQIDHGNMCIGVNLRLVELACVLHQRAWETNEIPAFLYLQTLALHCAVKRPVCAANMLQLHAKSDERKNIYITLTSFK